MQGSCGLQMNCSLTEASAMLDASVIAAHDRRSEAARECRRTPTPIADGDDAAGCVAAARAVAVFPVGRGRSEEHTSELQSRMRISYAVFSLNKQTYQPSFRTILSNTSVSPQDV